MLDHLINPDEDHRSDAIEREAERISEDDNEYLNWHEAQDPSYTGDELADMWDNYCWDKATELVEARERDAAEQKAERILGQ